MNRDLPIPAPRMWNQADGAAMMDDMGEHAMRVGRLDREDLAAKLQEKHALHEALMCCGVCNLRAQPGECDCMPAEAGSACSEFLTPNDAPKRRLGPLTALERGLLRRTPYYTWGVIVALSLVCAVQWVRS